MAMSSLGPWSASIPTSAETSHFAAAAYAFPGPTIRSTRATLLVPYASAATAAAPPARANVARTSSRSAPQVSRVSGEIARCGTGSIESPHGTEDACVTVAADRGDDARCRVALRGGERAATARVFEVPRHFRERPCVHHF